MTDKVQTKAKMEELTISNVRPALETAKLKTVVPEQASAGSDVVNRQWQRDPK